MIREAFETMWIILALLVTAIGACIYVAWHALALLLGVMMDACDPD